MSVDRVVMMSLDDCSFVVRSTCNYSSTTLVPRSMDILKLMWVDPWVKYGLVLLVYWVINGSGIRMEKSGVQ